MGHMLPARAAAHLCPVLERSGDSYPGGTWLRRVVLPAGFEVTWRPFLIVLESLTPTDTSPDPQS